MNLSELKTKLSKNKKIPADIYSLDGGLPNEVLCIARVKDKWEVYYSERGRKTNLKAFKVESLACEYFYSYLLKMLGI